MIDTKTSKQWFDPELKMFLPDRFVYGECPKCHDPKAYSEDCDVCGANYSPEELINPKSTVSDSKPELRDTDHSALPGLMEANAYACALYRFYAFHVADPGAPRGAKRSYREMQAVCLALGDEEVVAQIREAADAAVGIDGGAE